jgi:sodium/bile acid cotransporter 7
MTRTQFLKSQGFTVALIGAVLAAIAIPDLGIKGGPFRTETTTKIAVALIFLIQGLSFPSRQIAESAAKLRLHIFNQLCIFVAAPLLMLGFLVIVGNWMHPGIRSGFIYLAVLPTTISSAIGMTSNSDGDSTSALFSTTLSNILGLFITPLLCTRLLDSAANETVSLSALIGKLALLILLPIILGQVMRPFVREWAHNSKNLFKRLSNSFIVFVVYAAFCNSVKNGIWTEVGPSEIGVTLAIATVYLLFFSALVWFTSPIVAKDRSERIAIFFCGSQKTLAAGVTMASVIFAHYHGEASVLHGLIILPLMCYHPLQLLLAGAISPYFAKAQNKASSTNAV